MLKKLLIPMVAIAGGLAWGAFVAARRLWQRWGIVPAEAVALLPGDELVPDASAVDTRGIDIAAPPSVVWPWLVQMGYGRAGWYSYDQLDMNHPSADRIVPELQKLEIGDVMPTYPGGGFVVKTIEPEHAMVVYIDREIVDAQAKAKPEGLDDASRNVRATGAYLDRAVEGEFAASWAFVLQPTETGSRLIERFRVKMERVSSSGTILPVPMFARSVLGFGVFVMVRRQLLGIRDRAEGRPIHAMPDRKTIAAQVKAAVGA